ncbi:substrate-binding domain-containing protein [Mangrovicoccus algicola]|uniref:Substrate-binding domain-containing protein n=1 Tax=Mangrovicoccus algicola TaxID=2771008 RepID=A0A8J7CK57_9RHOB|nr:substrate-binding domain-containing protein [Mangrovicoccus algicola]MBE3638341.1 substrate-binding domain-containing protein [Mangrovicoccus algicola]
MTRFRLLMLVPVLLLPGFAAAQTVAVTMSNTDWTYTRNLADHIAAALDAEGVTDVTMMNAAGDRQAQLAAIGDFIAADVDAIIANLLATDDGLRVSRMAAEAGIPLVYVNLEPINGTALPEGQSYVGSDETESGTLEFGFVCDRLEGEGSVSFLIGDLGSSAARVRTQDYYALLETPRCAGIDVMDEGFANWSRDEGQALAASWIEAGRVPDAFVANNDDMALGALDAIQAAGLDKAEILVTGIDATEVALRAMDDGLLDATVLQNAGGQAAAAVEAALALARGDADVPRLIYVPFELVTPATRGDLPATN